MKRNLITILFVVIFGLGSLMAQDKVTHKVEPGQTMFFIAKKYNTSIAEIRNLNPEITDDLIIRPEQVIFIKSNIPAVVNTPKVKYKTHMVAAKETLYSISKAYGVTVDDLIQMNNLNEPNIQIGQELNVKKIKLNQDALFTNTPDLAITPPAPAIPVAEDSVESSAVPVVEPVEVSEVIEGDSDLYKTLFESATSKRFFKDKGIANFLEQGSDDAYLVLVNGVPKDQVLKVRNLMNNKIVYLKVIGELPKNDSTDNVSLKVSKAAARELNVIEQRFLAEWTWYDLSIVE